MTKQSLVHIELPGTTPGVKEAVRRDYLEAQIAAIPVVNEVSIGTSDPGATFELWYDTDADPAPLPSQAYSVCTATTRPAAPYAGMSIYETDTYEYLIWHGTQWRRPWKMPWGVLGFAQMTTTHSGITAVTDLTGLSVTFTPVANRLVRVRGQLGVGSTVSTDVIRMQLVEGVTPLQIRDTVPGAVSGTTGNIELSAEALVTPTAAAHTYKVQLVRLTGTGTLLAAGNAQYPCSLTVEDIGPNGAPA